MVQDTQPPSAEFPDGNGRRIAFCVSSFHGELTGAMLDSARAELDAAGVAADAMPVCTVPGAFELPLAARRFARQENVDAVIAIGLVLKGETRHDEVVADGAAAGLRQVMLECDKPVLLGVLTCESLEQARARALPPAEGGSQDKGRALARAALETLAALEGIEATEPPSGTCGFRVSTTEGVRP
ncbi:MAG: 6,7-dimethyl-8-ribityllumazine synthase [Planctomycetota bacterium]|jgi:6,7-dimethyl-8-ribityllumazine synthase|nr:6,7-dimethyl-8-ribityllumazine synthase [Planctomycetota bacterium]MDP6763444.1 6,7-dimethyl-8-ribityllumazine synthase [Planctomycetota bacterium]MDP6989616.1 6,7-dimethyl-8-ribityllumazine synthase [Planctomycetota bacterium]